MTNATSTSNPGFIVEVGEAYPYPSVIGPNFVTMKLSGKDTYIVWETQILCLLKSHQMYGFIDGQFPSPAGNRKGKAGDMEAWTISDSLVKGWILGSLSDGVAKKVVSRLKYKQWNTDFSAKDLWDELQRCYGPSVREQAAETKLTIRQAESVTEVNPVSEDAKSKDESLDPWKEKNKRRLYDWILKGEINRVIDGLKEDSLNPWYKLTPDGNTVLHVAVGSSTKNPELLEKLLEMTPPEEYTLIDLINSDGSTLLHVAAIGGNTEAVNMLVERNPELLLAKDKEGHTPLDLSISNMHIKTSHCLFDHMKVHGHGNLFAGQSGEDLVVLAISCQDLSLANMIIRDYPDAILSNSDAVLTALAQNFPPELNFWERDWKQEYYRMTAPYRPIIERFWNIVGSSRGRLRCRQLPILMSILLFMIFLNVICLVATMFYAFLKVLVRPLIEDTLQIHKDATNLLSAVLDKANSSTYHKYYTFRRNTSTFEATKRNTSTFIRYIMREFPDAIWSTNEDGHNFIQYSVIHRSEKIYNLLYEMSEHKNIYKTIKDSSGNNLLHLAARLSPPNILNQIRGPALQTQRELQWFKEVERFVCPLNRLQKNLDGETPQEVFKRVHKDLVIKGEDWIKKTAKSYTITTALIITIVFAAAITVPGGNNQESGIAIFTNKNTFTVFAISDAISLCTAVTSLLIFLSILTTERFVEEDFLYNLPKKLIIGLTMLFLSTTTMIIAFGATLFLMFGQSNLLMLIPIGALIYVPIMSVNLQFPLIRELIRATYFGNFFVRERYDDYFY